MADNFFKVKKGLNVEPQASPTLNQDGDIAVDSATNKLNVRLNGATDDVVLEDAAQTLTNKTLTTPVISSISNTGTLTLPTSTDTLVGRATTDTLTNKTLTAPTIDVATFDGQASAPSNPSAGNYKVYVDDTTSKLQILDSSGTVTTVGTSAGGINYITNGDAEAATTGWATYADAAGTSPVDGTGGSATTTFTRSTSSPLRGLGSFLLTKDAANRQGEGASYNFDIDSADGGKMMQITFDYAIASGTYATGDLAVYVIHDPNGTPKIIQPSGYQIENVGVNSQARLTFQTEVSAQLDYTLCFHVASTSASAYTVKLDNVQLGPQIVPLGAPVTDWVSYTPTISGLGTGSVASSFGKWRRVGDSMEIQYNWTKDGSGGSGAVSVATSLPSGYTVDTSKIPNGANFVNGEAYSSLTTDLVQVVESSTGSGYFIKRSTATTFNGADATANSNYRGYFKVPIVGWSSSTVVSSSADTRVVAMTARNYSNGTLASGATHTVILNTVATDTHGAYNSATGEYTVKVPGMYSINGEIGMTATAAAATRNLFFYIRVNGTGISNTFTYAYTTSNIIHKVQARVNWYCNVGDVITLVTENDLGGTGTPQTGTGNSNFSINLIQGPSQIAASEVIAMQTGGTPTGGNTVPFIFPTLKFETHGSSYNATTGVFTCPAPGIYQVSTVVNITNVISVSVYKNGSSYGIITATIGGFGTGTALVSCNAGDTITIVGGSAPGAASSSSFSVSRLGGVM